MTTVKTNINEITNHQITTLYNQIAEKQVKKFRDAPTAKRRLTALLEEKGLVVVNTNGLDHQIIPVSAATEVPTKERRSISADAKITVLVPNPKRETGTSHARFALYKDGMTVQQYVDAAVKLQGGKTAKYRTDIIWDLERNFISLSE